MHHLPFLVEREILRKKVTLLCSDWVLGRVSCLGLELFDRAFSSNKFKLINTQKGRVDCVSGYVSGREARPKSKDIFRHLRRHDIASLVVQQQIFSLPSKRPKFILIDSYSELTDQKFSSIKNRYSFCCNYSDLDTNKEFKSLFTCEGLLSLNSLGEYYDIFFKMLTSMYGNVPIIFIHFPSGLESRKDFINRADRILVEIRKIQKKYNKIHQISINSSIELSPDGVVDDDFPYHYHEGVYVEMARQLKLITSLYEK